MSYEKFLICARMNKEFEVIPERVKLLAEGIGFTDEGYMRCYGETYIPDKVKLSELPEKLRALFVNKTKGEKGEVVNPSDKGIVGSNDNLMKPQPNSTLSTLNDTLLAQLNAITSPKNGATVTPEALKTANTVCNIADKILTIADLSLKAEELSYKKQRNLIK